jgi:hypothetical protein
MYEYLPDNSAPRLLIPQFIEEGTELSSPEGIDVLEHDLAAFKLLCQEGVRRAELGIPADDINSMLLQYEETITDAMVLESHSLAERLRAEKIIEN